VLEYQTAVMRRDFETADKVLPTIPKEQRTRVAHFLEKQGFKQQALAVSSDPEHRFELAVQLCDMKTARELATEANNEQKWKQLAELATSKSQFELAQECLHKANDYGGLLLLATSSGNTDMVKALGETASSADKNNVSFLSSFLLGNLEDCLETLIKSGRLPEAAFFARTYLPSEVNRVLPMWKSELAKVNEKAAQSLADPENYQNLFPNFAQSLETQKYLERERKLEVPASKFLTIPANHERDPLSETDSATAEIADSSNIETKKPESFAIGTVSSQDVEKELEDELEKDLEGLDINDVDTSDVVLDDDDLLDEN